MDAYPLRLDILTTRVRGRGPLAEFFWAAAMLDNSTLTGAASGEERIETPASEPPGSRKSLFVKIVGIRKEPDNRAILAWLGGVVAVISAGTGAAAALVFDHQVSQVKAGDTAVTETVKQQSGRSPMPQGDAMISTLAVAEPLPNTAKPGTEFSDCANNCPRMIVVPAGKFMMGSPESEDGRYAGESPQHEVRIGTPFAVSKYEVTFEEWDACAAAGVCPEVKDQWGRGRMPVINVIWDDAKQYVGWLSRSTGKAYRLLTESEWEYAARAGTTTRFYWGDDVGKNNANCGGCGSKWDNQQTAPVGSFQPNAFGLYDMAGNVWEWVEDVWHNNYEGAPTDGSAWVQGRYSWRRVVRGGSWGDIPRNLRAASRDGNLMDARASDLGFRVARALTP
jgi:formylglycine-generating enzyme required for sulfatase activity